MRVLGVCSYPKEAAATRFRLEQFVEPLKAFDIELCIRPFLSSAEFRELYTNRSLAKKLVPAVKNTFGRFLDLVKASKCDLLLVQREAMPFGPAVFEWLCQYILRLPMVLDLDDATYVGYTSPRFGRVGSALKFFGKTDRLIKSALLVVCGNRFIAEHVEALGTNSVVVPTMADTNLFCPTKTTNSVPMIGWIGTHSTLPALEWLFPVLQRLAAKHKFVLRIVGAGQEVSVDGVDIENKGWCLENEIADFQSIDIGLYPIALSESASQRWLEGKSGFKAIEYMAVGVPFVMSPVGVCSEIGISGETHFNAETHEDWYNSLDRLLSDRDLRVSMGKQGREYSISNFDPMQFTASLANALKQAVNTR